MRIVVNTPAGNVGRVVTDKLLAAGETLHVISRSPVKVADLTARGARLFEGSIDEPATLDRAFAGADALLWLTPFAYDQPNYNSWAEQLGRSAAEAAKRHGVRRAVVISSVGAQHESGVGPISCLFEIEKAFKESVPNVTVLRAGSFMENFLSNVGTIATAGAIFSAYPSSKKIPWVATRDIAEKAVEALRDEHWRGFRVTGVQGPEDLDQNQAAELISAGIGRPVRHVEVSLDQAKQGMIGAGLPPHVAESLGQMYQALSEGRMERAEPRDAETTTKTGLL